MDARRANGVTIIKEGMVIQMNARIPNNTITYYILVQSTQEERYS